MKVLLAVAMFLAGWLSLCEPVPAQSTPLPQTDATYVPTMTFDVASVRVSNQDPNLPHMVGGTFRPHSTNLKMGNVGLYYVVTMAYGVDMHRVQGLPNWGSTSFNIEAKSDADADAKVASLTSEQQRSEQQHMLQALLSDRFHFRAHWETAEKPVYHLILAKGGSKMHPAGSMEPDASETSWSKNGLLPPLHQQGNGRRGYIFYGHSPMESLAQMLGSQMGEDVVNETGLTGKFDFRLQYSGRTASDNEKDDPRQWTPMVDAVQDQLGLKLEPAKGMVKMLVIDHVEMPTEN